MRSEWRRKNGATSISIFGSLLDARMTVRSTQILYKSRDIDSSAALKIGALRGNSGHLFQRLGDSIKNIVNRG